MILDELSFEHELSKNKIIFFGSGVAKWKMICKHENAIFKAVSILPGAMSKYSNNLFLQQNFAELAYSEPFYLKEFQTLIPPQNNNPQ